MSGYRWAGWPPVEVWVRCQGGHLHTVRWESGELSAVDHGPPDDETAPCLALTRAWIRHEHDLRVLTLAARDAADALALGAGPSGIPESRPAHSRGTLPEPPWSIILRPRGDGAFAFGMVTSLGDAPPPVDGTRPDHDIGVLLNLGHGLGERLVTGVATHWAERVAADPDVSIPGALALAVEEHARRALTTWWGEPVEVTVTADDPATLVAEGPDDETAHLTVPVSWLADVWCRDIVLADDAFVLAVEQAEDDHVVVRAALDDLDGDRRITVTLPVAPREPEPQPDPAPAPAAAPPPAFAPEWDEEAAEPGRPFLVRRLDVFPGYGQLYLTSGFTDVFDHENAYLDALEDATGSRRFVGTLDRALIDILLPGWGKPYTPLTIEVWPHTPPDDLLQWDHEVDLDLDVSGTLLFQGSGGISEGSTTVPAGEFRTRISGRNYDDATTRDGGGIEAAASGSGDAGGRPTLSFAAPGRASTGPTLSESRSGSSLRKHALTDVHVQHIDGNDNEVDMSHCRGRAGPAVNVAVPLGRCDLTPA